MDADTSLKILVVVLATVLAIFLVLAIVLIVKIIQVVKLIKQILEKAEQIADKAEAVGEFFEHTATPVAVGKLIAHIADNVFKKGKNRGK